MQTYSLSKQGVGRSVLPVHILQTLLFNYACVYRSPVTKGVGVNPSLESKKCQRMCQEVSEDVSSGVRESVREHTENHEL